MSNNQACTERVHKITENDLPLCCPLKDRRVWDAHPRVYFPIEETREYLCPYCGTKYILEDE